MDAEEHQLQDEEDKSYVRGRIAYVALYLSHRYPPNDPCR